MEKELKNYPVNSENSAQRLIRSFGRIKSRKLSPHKNFLLENFLPLYEIKLGESQQAQNFSKICLEIGFGFGDFLFEKAQKNPDTLFFGCEPHINGVINLLAKLEKEPLPNLKISKQDVRILLSCFPEKFFDQIFILFPDPWPKLKHFKRRLISLELLDEVLAPKMKSNSQLTIATDHDSYKTWILSQILSAKNFYWNADSKKDWQNFPDDWVTTKYQKKAANEGRTSIILNLIRNV
jgi:tRNA (guanine-N7-)-methyltransferase